MSIHKTSIRAILFRDGTTKKSRAKASRKIRKDNALPSIKDIRRTRSNAGKKRSRKSLSWIFRGKK